MATWDEYKKTMEIPDSIFVAAKDGDLVRIRAHLAKDLDINAKDSRGYSALMLAAYAGNDAAVALLLKAGADPNTADYAGNTALMGMGFKGHVAIAQQLLATGADLHAINAAGMTASDFATAFGRTEIAALLRTSTGGGPAKNRWLTWIRMLRGILMMVVRAKRRPQ